MRRQLITEEARGKIISTTVNRKPIWTYQFPDGRFYGLAWQGDVRIVTDFYDKINELHENIENKTATWFVETEVR